MRVLNLTVRFLVLLIILACLLFALLQSKWAREEIKRSLLSTLAQMGVEAHLSPLEGRLPFSWSIENAVLRFSSGEALTLHKMTLRLKVISLLRGQVAIDYLHIEEGELHFSANPLSSFSLEEAKRECGEFLSHLHLPFPLHLNHVTLDRFTLMNEQAQDPMVIGALAHLLAAKDLSSFDCALHLFSPLTHVTYFEGTLKGDLSTDRIEAAGELRLNTLPFPGELLSSLHVEGSWGSWKRALYDIPSSSPPLAAQLTGNGMQIECLPFPFLNGDWRLQADLEISSSLTLQIQKLSLQSPQFQLHAKGSVSMPLGKSDLILTFSSPDLASYSPVSGTLEGKGMYKEGEFKLSCKAHNLHFATFETSQLLCRMQGTLQGSSCQAEVELTSQDPSLPLESHFFLDASPATLSLKSLQLTSGADSLRGDLSYDVAKKLYTGSLVTSIQNIARFESLFGERRFHGQIDAELSFQPEESLLSLKGHRLRYEEILIDELSFQGTLQGHGELLADKVYARGVYFDKIHLGTHLEEHSSWGFTLGAEGRLDTPFSLSAAGRVKPGSLTLSECQGELLETPFHLEHPLSLLWGNEERSLSPLDLSIGSGMLKASFALTSQESLLSFQAEHFPLHWLRALYPRLHLSGQVTAQGFAKGDGETLQGSINLLLEESSLTPLGRETPLHSKGALQLHFNESRAQLHVAMQASDSQFLDLAASFPIKYHPFSLSLDLDERVSAELTAEGKLEDLFDFVNLGTNHFTGLLSCRLFLSQTLASPSLVGSLEWQNGTYDNYFTGITLKEIDAQFEAEGSRARLKHLTAHDEGSGALEATGTLSFKPQEHFPYQFNIEMQNLHALGFDMIDCHLSGPLYLTGTTREMLTQGNLLIDKAKIELSENLPYDVSSLPFTYIHKPSHLRSETPQSTSPFAFHLDLELSAADKVKVEGKGLNAELEGDIHLHGTNIDIAANGQLNLVRGEYLFSGKAFKLTEASVVFNDKPTRSAYLNVSGTLSLPDITITAMMRGPLTTPQLTFQSNPHKSTSSILALILFNKDISEINHMEALQLASAVISLSGGAGPDVLESIRKTLGVDRLNISSGTSADEIAVQIGKYLTKGVLITLSQSATSSQVIVEVEMPKGFVFQAETQEQEEGKFSLKWRKSY